MGLAIAAVAVAEEEVADQKTDEQFLTAFRYGYPYASAAYVAPTSYVAPTTYVAPASVAAPVHVKYATSLPAYTYTAGAYPYTYPSTLGIRSTLRSRWTGRWRSSLRLPLRLPLRHRRRC